jgi:Cu/Ag efflux protein CusF
MTKVYHAALFTLILAVPGLAAGQPSVSKSNTVRGSATIQAIDATTRSVTLKLKDGGEETFKAGPEITRFNELKVGDTIEVAYVESIVMRVQKPGEAPAATSGDAAMTRNTGRPGATLGAQVNTTVTVKAIDPAVPSITVVTQDGRTVTRKIEDKKNLDGVKVGDKIAITYTEAILMNVSPAKK